MTAIATAVDMDPTPSSAGARYLHLEPLICDADRKAGIAESLFERAQEIGFTMLSAEHLEQLEHAVGDARESARAVRCAYGA